MTCAYRPNHSLRRALTGQSKHTGIRYGFRACADETKLGRGEREAIERDLLHGASAPTGAT